jgi:hypothetical protein
MLAARIQTVPGQLEKWLGREHGRFEEHHVFDERVFRESSKQRGAKGQ